jgi:hypothetical protein
LTWLFLLGSTLNITPAVTCDICGQPSVLFLREAEDFIGANNGMCLPALPFPCVFRAFLRFDSGEGLG